MHVLLTLLFLFMDSSREHRVGGCPTDWIINGTRDGWYRCYDIKTHIEYARKLDCNTGEISIIGRNGISVKCSKPPV